MRIVSPSSASAARAARPVLPASPASEGGEGGPFAALQVQSDAPARRSALSAAALLAREAASELGLRVVRLRLGGGPRPCLQLMLERSDGSLALDDCVAASKAFSSRLDAHDPLPFSYTLEVSSPGDDRPLTREEDFAAHLGAQVEARWRREDGRIVKRRGILAGVETQGGATVLRLQGEDKAEQHLALAEVSEVRLDPRHGKGAPSPSSPSRGPAAERGRSAGRAAAAARSAHPSPQAS